MTFLNKKNYIEASKIILLTIAFFAVIFVFDRIQRLNYLYQNNFTKYNQVENAYQKEIIFIKDLNFVANDLDQNKELFADLQLKQNEIFSDYEKFILTKDITIKKSIIYKANQNSLTFKEYRNKFYKENSTLEKEVNEYNQQITEYNNYLKIFPNYLIARILDYAEIKTIY